MDYRTIYRPSTQVYAYLTLRVSGTGKSVILVITARLPTLPKVKVPRPPSAIATLQSVDQTLPRLTFPVRLCFNKSLQSWVRYRFHG